MNKFINSSSFSARPNPATPPASSTVNWAQRTLGFASRLISAAALSLLLLACLTAFFGINGSNSTFVATAEAKSDAKIATVDVSKVLNDSDEGKEHRAKLDALSAAAKKKLETKRAALKSLEEKLRASNATEDSPGAKDFRNQARDFSRMVKDSEDEVRQEFVKVNKKLTEKVLKIIKQYAEENEIDLILDKGVQERTLVLFGAPQADITSQIVARMNK